MIHQKQTSLRQTLDQLAHSGGGYRTYGNRVTLYYEGDEVFQAMRQEIASAQEYVHLEMYMFLSDSVGWAIAESLADRARAGISVCVVYDAIGSLESGEQMFTMMQEAGVEVRIFRPVAPWRKRSGILGRNHRKNLIVDGRIAFTGGMNLGEVWSREVSGDQAWRDTHISLEGPAAEACEHLFAETWRKVGGSPSEAPNFYEIGKVGPWESECFVVGGSGFAKRKAMRRLYSTILKLAKTDVVMTVPYFVPPRRLLNLLRITASEKSVEVLVPKNSDVGIADWVREGLYPALLESEVKIQEYMDSILHAKSMVVDDEISVVGSANFDVLSFAFNWELAVVIADEKVVKSLRSQHEKDLLMSQAVASDWAKDRPWWRQWIGWLGATVLRRL